MKDKLLSAVAMCRGAGKLSIGFDAACAAAQKGAPMVLVASDAAERTRKNIARCCGSATRLVELDRTQQEIEAVVGRKFAVAAVADGNFARLIGQNLVESGKEADA
jgi:ribosomal protein L30E